MSKMNDGGYAYPQSQHVGDVAVSEGGMTLRDYFAAKAMAAYWADPDATGHHAEAAEWAYGQADAMLAAREK